MTGYRKKRLETKVLVKLNVLVIDYKIVCVTESLELR